MDVKSSKTPAALGFAMPAEWERHERTLIAWPCRRELWGDAARLARARAAHAHLACAIAEFEPVVMIARAEDAGDAERQCGPRVEILALPIDDSWIRDNGPIFVLRDGEVAGTDWQFNAWGQKFEGYAADDAVPARIAERLELTMFKVPMVLEGGSIQVDGAGLLVTTEECLLNPNRNSDLSHAEIEVRLKATLGVREILWLPYGLSDDETDGHVDNVAAFAGEGRLLLHAPSGSTSPDFARMSINERAIEEFSSESGRRIEIVRMPAPARRKSWTGDLMPASYVNFYVANGAVFCPRFDDKADDDAARILADCFEGREVVQILANDIIVGGGGLHCITQQQPAGKVWGGRP